MAKISNKIKVKNEDGTFEDIQISCIGQNGTTAEGIGTVATAKGQHVQGKYNIEDIEKKYAHIVGNGEENIPSNAHTLDWDGNAWFAGDIKLGGTGQDDSLAISLLNKITELELKIQLLENKLNTL